MRKADSGIARAEAKELILFLQYARTLALRARRNAR